MRVVTRPREVSLDPSAIGILRVIIRRPVASASHYFGAYSAELLAGTKQRFSSFNQPRQWGDDVLRMLVTGAPPIVGGGGMPHRIVTSSVPLSVLRTTGAG